MTNDVSSSYKLNSNVGNKVCSTCRESLRPFIPNDFKVGNNYVDRAIFDSLAKELCEFKIHITSELRSIGGGQV